MARDASVIEETRAAAVSVGWPTQRFVPTFEWAFVGSMVAVKMGIGVGYLPTIGYRRDWMETRSWARASWTESWISATRSPEPVKSPEMEIDTAPGAMWTPPRAAI